MGDLEKYLTDHRRQFEDDLCRFLEIPSVSTEPRYRDDVHRAAVWIVEHLESMGFASEIIEADGHPIVFAESPPVPAAPVVLVYGHYDVQPPDPLDEWTSPPFQPTKRNGNIYARGATDDKGQLLAHVKSAEAWIRTRDRLPVQLKFVIEGEEEIGSRNLLNLLNGRYGDDVAHRLACDVVVISDTSQFGPGQPAITCGLRGIAEFELMLQGPRHDLHSGSFGGAVANPANALMHMLAALVDQEGKIQIPGFYDDVKPLTEHEQKAFRDLAFDDEAFKRLTGVNELNGEIGYSTLERRWARPAFDIHGISGGYQGCGGKNIVPARAAAKFSFRLVPAQDPKQISIALKQFLVERCPRGIHMELETMDEPAPPVVIPLESPYMVAASEALRLGFGCEPVFIREGGSIPVVAAFYEKLEVESLLIGLGQPDDHAHGPDEKLSLDDFHRGIKTSAHLWQLLADIPRHQRLPSLRWINEVETTLQKSH